MRRGDSGGTRVLNEHASLLDVLVVQVFASLAPLSRLSVHSVGLGQHPTVRFSSKFDPKPEHLGNI